MQKEYQRQEGTEGGNTNRRSEIQILLEETCLSFYPEFTPIFSQDTTDQVNDALGDLDSVAADNSEGKKSIKEQKKAFQEALHQFDESLCSMLQDLNNQMLGIVDYLNQGVPHKLLFSYGPYNSKLNLIPIGGEDGDLTDKEGEDENAGIYSLQMPYVSPYRLEAAKKKPKKNRFNFTQIEEDGEIIPVMSVSLEDLLNEEQEAQVEQEQNEVVKKEQEKKPEEDIKIEKPKLFPRFKVKQVESAQSTSNFYFLCVI